MRTGRALLFGLIAWLGAGCVEAVGQECEKGWSSEFANYSLGTGVYAGVHDFAVFDDGTGPALFATVNDLYEVVDGGTGVVRWDGTEWRQVGGAQEWVTGLAVFDDGGGAALYVAGGMPGLVARLVGNTWLPVGTGLGEGDWRPWASDLLVFDDGSGPALYAGGDFIHVGNELANGVARWDGSDWSSVGTGPPNDNGASVSVLGVLDGGTGAALYAGGYRSDDSPAGLRGGLARWDGKIWESVDTGFRGSDLTPFYSVQSLTVWDAGDGAGPGFYIGGTFVTVHGIASRGLVRWDGGDQWTPIVPLLDVEGTQLVTVVDQCVFDAGSGPELYVSGSFDSAGGVPLNGVAKWDGKRWFDLKGGVLAPKSAGAWSLASFDDGRGPGLIVGGHFQQAGDIHAESAARWDGSKWSHMGINHAAAGGVLAFAVYDSGNGPETFAGGQFDGVDGRLATGVACHTADGWRPAGMLALNDPNGDPPIVRDMVVYDDGSGPALYIGGKFDGIDEIRARGLAKWDGHGWSSAGDLDDAPWGYGEPYVTDLGVYDLGSGPALYACGVFGGIGGAWANNIARWDGDSWAPVGWGVMHAPLAMEEFDDGSGPALVVGGYLTSAGGKSVKNLARWDGADWFEVGGGVEAGEAYVGTLKAWDDGAGEALFVGGRFRKAGGKSGFSNIAKWDGASWSSMGTGVNTGEVDALDVYDLDGSGPKLLVGGGFWLDENWTVGGLVRWDGQSLSDAGLNFGYHDGVYTMWAPAGPTGGAFWMAGGFRQVVGVPSYLLAQFTRCPCAADCDLSNSLDLLDYLCFSVLFDSADPAADCDGSGALDLFDFLCFVNAFNAGCP